MWLDYVQPVIYKSSSHNIIVKKDGFLKYWYAFLITYFAFVYLIVNLSAFNYIYTKLIFFSHLIL